MENLGVIIILLSFVLFFIAIVGMFRGKIKFLRVQKRKNVAYVFLASIVMLFSGAALLPTTDTNQITEGFDYQIPDHTLSDSDISGQLFTDSQQSIERPNKNTSQLINQVITQGNNQSVASAVQSESSASIPSAEPIAESTSSATVMPISPAVTPSANAAVKPTADPTVKPSANVTVKPNTEPTAKPSANVTVKPTAKPTVKPSANVTVKPTAKPTVKPSANVTVKPTAKPTVKPSANATTKPTAKPTVKPSATPPAIVVDDDDTYYKNCSEVRAAGKAPLYRGDPGYRKALDRDNDGIACE